MAARVDRDHPKMFGEQRREQIEAATMVEHAVRKHDRRRLGIAPFMQTKSGAIDGEHLGTLGRYGIGMKVFVHGTRDHNGMRDNVTIGEGTKIARATRPGPFEPARTPSP